MEHAHVDKKVVNRLARIEGQVRSIRRMVESGTDCSDVLVQVAAARSALYQAGRLILEGHLEHCIVDALEEGESGRGKQAFEDLKIALKRFVG